MSRSKKIIFIILILILMLAFFSITTFYQYTENLSFRFLPLSKYPLIGQYFPPFLFWLSVVLIAIGLISIIVILLFPKKIEKMKLQKNKGTLSIESSAIKGFVQSIVDQKSFIEPPKVKVAVTKRKIKVKIIGELKRTTDLIQKSESLIDSIETNLKQLIGVQQEIKIDVAYHGYKDNQSHEGRVI